MRHADEYDALSRSSRKLMQFTDMIEELRARNEEVELPELFDEVMERTGYLESLALDKETWQDRTENIQELKSNLARYMEENEDGDLSSFLEEVSLLSDIDSYNEQSDVVVLMTLHSAKGLEFPIVFIAGMEDGLFPGRQSLYDQSEMEEERRLAYVGITRAKEKLYLTNAMVRMLYGSTSRNAPSRFLAEIPDEYIERGESQSVQNYQASRERFSRYGGGGSYRKKSEFNPFAGEKATGKASTPTGNTYSIGDTVYHKAFGTGVILSVKPMGNDQLLEIAFDKAGTKKVMANFAKLTKK